MASGDSYCLHHIYLGLMLPHSSPGACHDDDGEDNEDDDGEDNEYDDDFGALIMDIHAK